jgi:hypothetical protein
MTRKNILFRVIRKILLAKDQNPNIEHLKFSLQPLHNDESLVFRISKNYAVQNYM